ncbi:MAG: hypothetical protein ABSG81_14150 [Acidimicrobiales bacterium]
MAVALPVLVWVVTQGTWNLFQTTFFGNFYDTQARALFHGHWYVPADVVQIEGFAVRGHTYMYFGPFPSLLRMPVLLFTSRLDGRLTEVSIVLAVLVALGCAGHLAWRIRGLMSRAPVSVREAVLVAFGVAALGTGSVFLFLASQAVVYNEAEAWGAALAIAAFDALVGFVLRPSTRGAVGVAVLVTLDLLTRGSVALGPLAALAILAVAHGAVWLTRRTGTRARRAASADRWAWLGVPDASSSPTRAVALSVSALVALAAYAAVNDMKFGSPFSIPFASQVYAAHNAPLRHALAANGGSLLGLQFVPTALVQYLRPDALRFGRPFPFVAFPPPATVSGNVRYASRNLASSVTATMPALAVLCGIGLWTVFRPGRRAGHARSASVGSLTPLRVPLAGAAVGVISAVAYAYIIERYLADWMPLLVLGGATGLCAVVLWSRTARPWARRVTVVGGVVLALVGVVVNVGLSLANQGELTPSNPVAVRTRFVRLQQRVDRALYGDPPPGVSLRATLPATAPAGSLVVLGQCAALFQSDGSGWNALEQSGGGGHYRLAVTFPAVSGAQAVYWPLVVTGAPGAGDYVAVRPVGPDEVSFAYQFQTPSATWFDAVPVRIRPGHRYVVDVVVDADTGHESVELDGVPVLGDLWFARQSVDATEGTDTIGGPTAPAFPGGVERLSTPTPLCNELRRDAQSG